MTPGGLDALRSVRPTAARGFEGSGRHGFERQSEVFAVRAETLEGPGEIALHGDADGAAGRDNPEQHTGAVCAFAAAGKEHVEAELRDVLEFALRR